MWRLDGSSDSRGVNPFYGIKMSCRTRKILQFEFSGHFLIILVFLEYLTFSPKIWPFLRDFGQILGENIKNSKITKIIKKCLDAILDNIILHNLAKFQLSRSFWTWVISIFVRYQKITICSSLFSWWSGYVKALLCFLAKTICPWL